MKQEKTKRYLPHTVSPVEDVDLDDELPLISNVVSGCECTGIIPRPPINEAEEEADRSLFSNALPACPESKRDD